ncbi:unannotated protein [freshwater metagenome]|uniref:Unannotated protein n=1 Tax=freshwater metagenome TaxID=449393 RepID=A0A6J7GQI3_9ZZZZ|nr:hypothetical protein [Actinomycetota bacterium]
MLWHRFSPHVNRPVLHLKLFTDGQLLPVVGLVLFGTMYMYGGLGSFLLRFAGGLVILLPVAVMALDNRSGQTLRLMWFGWKEWNQKPGVYDQSADDLEIEPYVLTVDPEELAREANSRNQLVDVATLFDPAPEND